MGTGGSWNPVFKERSPRKRALFCRWLTGGKLLSFARPKESNQSKGQPLSLDPAPQRIIWGGFGAEVAH